MDFQQREAVISSLNHNTIIWGPPGTGKSQVITNLIANILCQPETRALIVSEKKTALDIIYNRLGSLKFFIFFNFKNACGRNSKKEKKEFYDSLNKFLKIIIEPPVRENQNYKVAEKLLPSREYQAWKSFSKVTTPDRKKYNASLKILELFNSKEKFNKCHLLLQNLNLDYKYPSIPEITEYKNYVKTAAKLNNIRKKFGHIQDHF